eukprot:2203512-Rhodomonas_salina.1
MNRHLQPQHAPAPQLHCPDVSSLCQSLRPYVVPLTVMLCDCIAPRQIEFGNGAGKKSLVSIARCGASCADLQ